MLSSAAIAQTLVIEVTQFGAVSDGVTSNTAAIQKAIDACHTQGGGTVRIPAGRFLSGTIQIKDNVILRLEENAVLLGTTDAAEYRNLDPFLDGLGQELGYALVVAVGAKNVGLEGPGAIDGQGRAVRAAQTQNRGKYTVRPFLVRWVKCTQVAVKDVNLGGPGAWTMNFFQCENVVVDNVTIHSRGLANNDGIDIDSCRSVLIKNCDIDSGDDAICLKATSRVPCRDITITGCQIKTSCNGIKLGTESLGDFHNIDVSNCQIRDTGFAGLAFFSVDGSDLHDVTVSDVTMDRVTVPIIMRLGARLKTFRAGDEKKPAGIVRNISIKNVRAKEIRQIGVLISGIPGHRVKDITLENIQIDVLGGGKAEDANVELAEKEATYPEVNMFGKIMPAYGMYVRHAENLTFKNVTTTASKPDPRPAIVTIDVNQMTPPDFTPSP